MLTINKVPVKLAAPMLPAYPVPAPVLQWLDDNRAKSAFAASLFQQLKRYGKLSPKQVEAVEKNLQPKVVMSVAEGVDKIGAAFQSALAHGLKRPKLHFDGYTFKPAKPSGLNPGAIYVTTSNVYLGKIVDGGFTGTNQCSDTDRLCISIICNDPFGGAVSYGKLTGNCACCGRPLTDPKSVELGIGPVCKVKYGW
jgi:hypothetical protein